LGDDDGIDPGGWSRIARLPPWRSTVVGDHARVLTDPAVHVELAERLLEAAGSPASGSRR
jgi:hypothetical protein